MFRFHSGEIRGSAFSLLAAFLLLSATLGLAVWWVSRSVRAMTQVTKAEQQADIQRRATNRLLKLMLLSGTQAEMATLHYADDQELERYLRASENLDSALVRMRPMLHDTVQQRRVDTLQSLVWMRRDATVGLVAALRKENHYGADLQKQIDRLHEGRHPVRVQMEVPVVQQDRQLVIERRKKGFFRRLGDAFRKGREDTLSMQTNRKEVPSDTSRAEVDIADTVARYLSDVHRELRQNSMTSHRRLNLKSERLQRVSAELSQRMALLVDQFAHQQQADISKVLQKERHERLQSAWTLGLLALFAIGVSALLLVWLQRDIKRANRYRKDLAEEKRHTEELMERREQLLLTISHDIKAPVNSIVGYLHLLPAVIMTRYQELDAVARSAHHLLRLVERLLDYHRLEAGHVEAHMEATQVKALVHEAATTFLPLAQVKGLDLEEMCKVPDDLWVRTDAFRLRQILDNLLGNAVKYTQAGRVSLSAEWKAAVSCLQVIVQDTGCGMPEQDLVRIFDPFARVKGSEGQEGSGLGLSIALQLVKLLGGTLTAESREGQGSRFTLALPCSACQAPGASDVRSSASPHSAVSIGKPCEVALIDDDALQLHLAEAMVRNVLPEAGAVVAFADSESLFSWLDEGHCPSFVLTDIEMPSLSGYELLQLLRRRLPAEYTQVVAMTSHTLLPYDHFLEEGFDGVLFKPFNQNDLESLFGKTLHAAQPEEKAAEVSDLQKAFAPLLTFAEGDRDAENAILQQFRKDCCTHHEALLESIRRKDKHTLCAIAHKMLPTFTLLHSAVSVVLQELNGKRSEPQWSADDEASARKLVEELERVMQKLDECGIGK